MGHPARFTVLRKSGRGALTLLLGLALAAVPVNMPRPAEALVHASSTTGTPGDQESPEPESPEPQSPEAGTTNNEPIPESTATPPSPPRQPQGKVIGRVVNPRGAGVARARVVLFDRQWNYLREVRARPSGRFTFAKLAPGRYRLQVRDGRPAWNTKSFALRDATVRVRANRTTVTVVKMRRGAFLTGRVTRGKKNRPAARALVRANDANGRAFQVRADHHGRFALGGLPPGRYRIWGNDSRHQWVGRTVVVRRLARGTGRDVRIRMRTRAGGVNGYVMEGGRIARNPTWVTAIHRRTGQWWTARVRSGDLSLPGLAPGRYEFVLTGTKEFAGRTLRPRVKVKSGRTRHLVLRMNQRVPGQSR